MKKNYHFRRIPEYIEQELRNIQSQHIVAVAIIDISKADISLGELNHLGIKETNGRIEYPEILFPEQITGTYARRNRNGIVRILKHLPKITKTYSWDTPNFGDPLKGYHTIDITRKVYQRILEPPRDWEISIKILNQSAERIRLKAKIATILDRLHPDFRKDLFFAINLLQEQFRDCHVFDATINDDELARISTVGWEIFPAGTMDKTFSIITQRLRNQSPERKHEIQQRAEVLNRLNPNEYILGSGMNSHYFGAKFGHSIVAFENLDFGNALYILFDNWQEISQMSRIDILKRHEKDYIRIIHKAGWEKKLIRILEEKRGQ